MALVGGTLGVRLLNYVSRNGSVAMFPDEAPAYKQKSKLETLMGSAIWDEIRLKSVIDFGSGKGDEAIQMAQSGAARVVGVEIDPKWLEIARRAAERAGVSDRCTFTTQADERADVIISLDSFEHFSDPGAILRMMDGLLRPDGKVLVSFGPTWYHPLGGHLYPVFPWAHLIVSETALVRWRSLYKTDGFRSIAESGLNRMTIRRFHSLIAESPFQFEHCEAVPIRCLKAFHNVVTREFTTAIVRCTLVKRRHRPGPALNDTAVANSVVTS